MALPSSIFLPGGKVLMNAGKVVVNAEECCCTPYLQARDCSTNSKVNTWMTTTDAATIGTSAFKVPGRTACHFFNFADASSLSPGTIFTAASATTYTSCCRCIAGADCCCVSAFHDQPVAPCTMTVQFNNFVLCTGRCLWDAGGLVIPSNSIISKLVSCTLVGGTFDLTLVSKAWESCLWQLHVPNAITYDAYQDPANNCTTLLGRFSVGVLISSNAAGVNVDSDATSTFGSHLVIRTSAGSGTFPSGPSTFPYFLNGTGQTCPNNTPFSGTSSATVTIS